MITLSVKGDYFIVNFDKADEGVVDRMRKEDSILYKAFGHYNDSTMHELNRTTSEKYLMAILYSCKRYGVDISGEASVAIKRRRLECELIEEEKEKRRREEEEREAERARALAIEEEDTRRRKKEQVQKNGCGKCPHLKLIEGRIVCDMSGHKLKGFVDMYKEYNANNVYGMITEIHAKPDNGCAYL